jgi:hypothetical protein
VTVPANPPHQDAGVRVHRVHLATVLALLRVLAGPRGRASVLWWAGGFSYRLEVRRHPRTPYELDYDLGGHRARVRHRAPGPGVRAATTDDTT